MIDFAFSDSEVETSNGSSGSSSDPSVPSPDDPPFFEISRILCPMMDEMDRQNVLLEKGYDRMERVVQHLTASSSQGDKQRNNRKYAQLVEICKGIMGTRLQLSMRIHEAVIKQCHESLSALTERVGQTETTASTRDPSDAFPLYPPGLEPQAGELGANLESQGGEGHSGSVKRDLLTRRETEGLPLGDGKRSRLNASRKEYGGAAPAIAESPASRAANEPAGSQDASRRTRRGRRRLAASDVQAPAEQYADTEDKLYCVCQQVSSGEMICCENKDCKYEWFHFECVNITEAPEGDWYCDECSQQTRK